jgi:hypothetical protein
VSPNVATVAATYGNVKQQLPTVESIDAFLAAQQTGIAQLAIAYCNAMVNDATLRTQFYGSVDMNATSNDASLRTALITAVQTKIIGSTTTQPDSTFVSNSLTTMFNGLNGASAATAMKAACAAALGSAATTVQ